jgi:phosphoribosylformylglycinamidine synthase
VSQGRRKGLLRSAHDVSDGGLAVALAECCIGGPEKPLGARIELRDMIRGDALLFGESQSRIVVTVKRRMSPAAADRRIKRRRRCR